jgi:hypothetical protein|tara:strand:- start:409 stop:552 length:144 start_codon:yes stop_codon:yes gene_type:complete
MSGMVANMKDYGSSTNRNRPTDISHCGNINHTILDMVVEKNTQIIGY